MLIVDDFGIKYVGQAHLDHIIQSIKHAGYEIVVDKTGSLYCVITLEWNYKERYIDVAMPGYVGKMIARFKHGKPEQPQYSLHQPPLRKYGK